MASMIVFIMVGVAQLQRALQQQEKSNSFKKIRFKMMHFLLCFFLSVHIYDF